MPTDGERESLASFPSRGLPWHWAVRAHGASLSMARPTVGGCDAGQPTFRAWPGRRARSRLSMRSPREQRSWSPPINRIRATGSDVSPRRYSHPMLPKPSDAPCVRVGRRRLRGSLPSRPVRWLHLLALTGAEDEHRFRSSSLAPCALQRCYSKGLRQYFCYRQGPHTWLCCR